MSFVIKVRAATGAWVPLNGKHVEYEDRFVAINDMISAALAGRDAMRVEHFGGPHDGAVIAHAEEGQ